MHIFKLLKYKTLNCRQIEIQDNFYDKITNMVEVGIIFSILFPHKELDTIKHAFLCEIPVFPISFLNTVIL